MYSLLIMYIATTYFVNNIVIADTSRQRNTTLKAHHRKYKTGVRRNLFVKILSPHKHSKYNLSKVFNELQPDYEPSQLQSIRRNTTKKFDILQQVYNKLEQNRGTNKNEMINLPGAIHVYGPPPVHHQPKLPEAEEPYHVIATPHLTKFHSYHRLSAVPPGVNPDNFPFHLFSNKHPTEITGGQPQHLYLPYTNGLQRPAIPGKIPVLPVVGKQISTRGGGILSQMPRVEGRGNGVLPQIPHLESNMISEPQLELPQGQLSSSLMSPPVEGSLIASPSESILTQPPAEQIISPSEQDPAISRMTSPSGAAEINVAPQAFGEISQDTSSLERIQTNPLPMISSPVETPDSSLVRLTANGISEKPSGKSLLLNPSPQFLANSRQSYNPAISVHRDRPINMVAGPHLTSPVKRKPILIQAPVNEYEEQPQTIQQPPQETEVQVPLDQLKPSHVYHTHHVTKHHHHWSK